MHLPATMAQDAATMAGSPKQKNKNVS